MIDIEKVIRDYLPGVLHMSLGTSANNKPWVCEVHFVYDDALNIYWRSKADRRHSQDIASNPRVAGNIVEQHGISQKPRGLYFEGSAKVLEDEAEIHSAYELFRDRLEVGEEIIEDAMHPDGHRIYKVDVSDWYLFDSRESKPSQKYNLPR